MFEKIILSSLAGWLFACLVSFSDSFTWRLLNAFYRKSRKRIAYKWKYILGKHSLCESCGKKIRIFYLLPIIGSLLCRFRCSHCKKAVSKRFFWEELTSLGYGFLLFYLNPNLYFIFFSMIYFFLGYIILRVDWEFLLIPTEAILGFTLLSITEVILFGKEVLLSFWIALFWFLLFWLIRILSRYKMGLADVRLIFPLSLGLSFPYSTLTPTLASLLGIGFYILRNLPSGSENKDTTKLKIPFGSFLMLAFFTLRIPYSFQ